MDLTPGMLPQPGGPECDGLMGENLPTGAGPCAPSAVVLGHRAYLRAMAEELQMPLDEVALLYCKELAFLRSQAKVLDYLPVLVAKRLRALYKRVHGDLPSA